MSADDIITRGRQVIRQATDLTERTLRVRAKCYRGLVIGVGLVAFLSLIWPTIQWSWLPLLGFLLFLPLTGAFLYVDGLLINRWRHKLLELWADEQLDLDILCDVLCTVRAVPEQILQGMLSSLPTVKSLKTTEKIPPASRGALAATIQTINGCQSDRTLIALIAYTTGLASLALAAILASWLPLLALLLVIPIFGLGLAINGLRLRRWRRKLSALRRDGLPERDFVELAARLSWRPISEKKKSGLLEELREVAT
jgi:hypothetical protein